MESSSPPSGNLRVRRWTDTVAFRERVEPYLVLDEARHNLPLGILSTITDHPTAYSALPPYLATIESDAAVEGVALMTPPYNLLLSDMRRPDAMSALADALLEDRVDIPGVTAPVPGAERFVDAWSGRAGRRMERGMRQGIYRLDRVDELPAVEGEARLAGRADRELLVDWVVAFGDEVGQSAGRHHVGEGVDRKLGGPDSGFMVWEVAGTPVAVAGYGGLTPNGIRIGPVYTPPALRGRGYGTAVTAELSRRLLAGGRKFCFLYTDLANPTSNSIYRRMGYQQVGESEEWRIVR